MGANGGIGGCRTVSGVNLDGAAVQPASQQVAPTGLASGGKAELVAHGISSGVMRSEIAAFNGLALLSNATK